MSNNKGMTMADIRLRKQQLKDDLDVLEDNVEECIRRARTNMLKSVNLYEPIRKKPLRVVGMAIAAGLIVGLSRRKKTRNKSRRTDQRPVEYEEHGSFEAPAIGFRTLLADEIKRIAARREIGSASCRGRR